MTPRERIRAFVASTSDVFDAATFTDVTPLFSSGVLRSVHVLDLILLIEEITARPVDVERLGPGAFRDVDTICRTFLDDTDEGSP
jgi:hypothetical protein